jgi:glucokinase
VPWLCGDVGATHARLAIYDRDQAHWRQTARETLLCRHFARFDDILDAFLARHAFTGETACFGVAGPVVDGRCRVTNLDWTLDAAALESARGWRRVVLLNDLEATAHGLGELGPQGVATLQQGEPRAGNIALIAAGSGLGQAGLFFDGERGRPFATEGGHADFAPRNELEIELLRYFQQRVNGRVSVERVVSGPGLVAIRAFLGDRLGIDCGQREAAAISAAALAGTCPLCAEALDLFVELYAAEAGNLALKLMARGGVYLGGGIAPQILEALRQPAFREHFCAKGRMRPLLEAMPIHVVLDPDVALLGAAAVAAAIAT